MKRALVDTSSAILLFKSKLIPQLVSLYQTRICDSVYREITRQGYSGAAEFQQLCNQQLIEILPGIEPGSVLPDSGRPRLNAGEQDTIHHYQLGRADFIVLDDGRAARYCRKAGIPFINALLFPRILLILGLMPESDYHRKRNEIISYGRYAEKILKTALEMPDNEITPFLPDRSEPSISQIIARTVQRPQ